MSGDDRGWLLSHPVLGVTIGTLVVIGPMALVVALIGLRGAPLGAAVVTALVVGWIAGYRTLRAIVQGDD